MTLRDGNKTRGTTRKNDDVTTSDEMERNNATIKQTKRTWQDAHGGAMQRQGGETRQGKMRPSDYEMRGTTRRDETRCDAKSSPYFSNQ
jgi:hypothetical protein